MSVSAGWLDGPRSEQGTVVQLSERPLLCGCTDWAQGEAVIGGSDHGNNRSLFSPAEVTTPSAPQKTTPLAALYVLDVSGRAPFQRKRTLFTQTKGHREWVSCCAILGDGRVASGGMDGMLLVRRVRPRQVCQMPNPTFSSPPLRTGLGQGGGALQRGEGGPRGAPERPPGGQGNQHDRHCRLRQAGQGLEAADGSTERDRALRPQGAHGARAVPPHPPALGCVALVFRPAACAAGPTVSL